MRYFRISKILLLITSMLYIIQVAGFGIIAMVAVYNAFNNVNGGSSLLTLLLMIIICTLPWIILKVVQVITTFTNIVTKALYGTKLLTMIGAIAQILSEFCLMGAGLVLMCENITSEGIAVIIISNILLFFDIIIQIIIILLNHSKGLKSLY